MEIHHCAFKVLIGYSNILQKFCESLGAKLFWEGEDQGREIVMQFPNNFLVQFSEIDEQPIISDNKKETHLAFLSDNQRQDLERIKGWFEEKGVETKIGQWSDEELWLDCPDVFIDFVIEVFNTK